MHDHVLEAFLTRQQEEGLRLAGSSDLLDLVPLDGPPAQTYRAVFHCRGLVRLPGGEVAPAEHFEVGIWFPSDYVRHAEPYKVLTWLGPRHVFHPNIRAPFICIGRLAAGTPLADILYQIFEVITYQKVTMREDDALNKEACTWARRHKDDFPIDPRPLKRRRREVRATVTIIQEDVP